MFIEQQNKFVTTGKKFYEIIGKFKHHKTDKQMVEALKKIASIEKAKILAQEKPVVLAKNLKNPDLPSTGKEKALTQKEIEEEKQKLADAFKKNLKIGAKIKLKNQQVLGTLLEIDGNKLTVQLGNFTVKTKMSEIEF